ncbi:hypothetical protein GKN96_28200, partial [Klebsiella pneumoniae]|nr:hypothetical protein [Klebsiella pneumoniae]
MLSGKVSPARAALSRATGTHRWVARIRRSRYPGRFPRQALRSAGNTDFIKKTLDVKSIHFDSAWVPYTNFSPIYEGK